MKKTTRCLQIRTSVAFRFAFCFLLAFSFLSSPIKAQIAVEKLIDTAVFKKKTIAINGCQLAYREAGEGKPILFLHGSTGDGVRHFSKQLNEFVQTNRVIALDLRGHGASTFTDEPFTQDLLTDDVYKFLEAIKTDSLTIVGFSLGGGIGLGLAVQHPEKVKRLLTIGAIADFDQVSKSALDWANTWTAQSLKMVPECAEPDRFPLFVSKLKDLILTTKGAIITEENFKKITCPTLILAGDKDGFSKIEHQLFIHRAIAKSALCILPSCGHNAQNNQPQVFNALLKTFLAK